MAILQTAKEYRYRIKTMMRGIREYRRTGTTPEDAYLMMRDLYCHTRGYSNDVISALVKGNGRPYALPNSKGIMGDLSAQDVDKIVSTINEVGYYRFPQRAPEDLCDRLLEFALTTPCMLRPPREGLPTEMVYDRANPHTISYRVEEQRLFGCPDVQKLAADMSMLSIAQAYLGCPPVMDIVAMWWSAAFGDQASSEIAQLYHFDMDRLKFLKFFIYLTDVTPENGPHYIVARSHRRDGKPSELWGRGAVRIPDSDIERAYPKEELIEVCGPRGTIFAEDTRAFHKGKVVTSGDRLVLQYEFCNSLFGAPFTTIHLGQDATPDLLSAVRSYPAIYSKFVID